MPRLFDNYIMVDWSAASSPKTGKDSIWIAELSANTGRLKYANPATRQAAYADLQARLKKLERANARVLIGFDFSLGYPAGTAAALGLSGAPWDATHFWGVTSQKHSGPYLKATKPSFTGKHLPELRIVERYLRDQKLGTPKSVWQLAYIGSVGSQSLMGLPYVVKLREEFPSAKIWPFETGFENPSDTFSNPVKIIIAEIYPSLLKAKPKTGEPLDKAQVRAMARHYWEMDKSGSIGAAFEPPSQLNTADLSIIDAEEGWILGITPINIGNLPS